MSIYYLLCERKGEGKYQRPPLFTRTASATIEQCSVLLTLPPKPSYFPPPLGENFNTPEHYLQRGMFTYIADNVKVMKGWQKITTLIPLADQQQYFKANLLPKLPLRDSQEREEPKRVKIFIDNDHTNIEQLMA